MKKIVYFWHLKKTGNQQTDQLTIQPAIEPTDTPCKDAYIEGSQGPLYFCSK